MGCFADDTAFWAISNNLENIIYKYLQNDLNRFTDWSKYWLMSINLTKCSYICIHKPNKIPPNHNYLIDKKPISKVTSCKYLGLWIDSHLSLSTHITKIQEKLQQHLYHLYFLKNSGLELYPKTSLQIYKSKTRPCIEYASIFYSHNDKKNKIQTLQNKFIELLILVKNQLLSTLEMKQHKPY